MLWLKYLLIDQDQMILIFIVVHTLKIVTKDEEIPHSLNSHSWALQMIFDLHQVLLWLVYKNLKIVLACYKP